MSKKIYGLIGYPVKHSLSALMHNAAFKALGLDAEYRLFEVAPDKLEEFFKKTIFEEKLSGFNVTVPHKEKVIPYLGINNYVASVGIANAVNTVRVEENGCLKGFNTDFQGFSRDLKEHSVDPEDKNIALLGAGGGAKAIFLSLQLRSPKKILIFDVDKEKVNRLVEDKRENKRGIYVCGVNSIEELNIKEADVLINATPVGMKPEDPLLIKKEWLHKDLFVYDLIYNPKETKLLKAAKEVGCKYANGLGMLLYQGALAFEIWTKQDAPIEVMRKALEEGIKNI